MSRRPATLSGLYFSSDVNKNTGVSIPNISAYQGLSALTIECWVNLTNYPLVNTSKAFGYIAGNTGLQLFFSPNGGLSMTVGNGTTQATRASNSAIPLNQFVHLAGCWDGSTVTMFVNGVSQGGGSSLVGGNTGNPAISPYIGNQSAGLRAVGGTISEVRFSNNVRYSTNFTPAVVPFTSDANTLGLWHLIEGSGTTAGDSSSNANNGTLSSTPLPTWVNGYFNNGISSRTLATNRVSIQNFHTSLKSNGTSTRVTTPVILSNTNFNISFWYKRAIRTGSTQDLIDTQDGGAPNNGVLLTSDPSSSNFYYVFINGGVSTFGMNFPSSGYGEWHHYTITAQNNNVLGYRDGVQVFSQSSVTLPTSAQTLGFLARSRSVGANWAIGSIKQLIISNSTPWTAAQVKDLYVSSIIPSSPTAIFQLDEGAGTVAYDTSGNTNNGTIISGVYTSDVPTRKRQLVSDGLIYNGDFEYAPPSATNVATTTSIKWIDGTSGGSLFNIFGFGYVANQGTGSAIFDNTVSHSGGYSIKVTTAATSRTKAIASFYNTGSSLSVSDLALWATRILPNTAYTLSYWIKTLNADTGAAFVSWDQMNGAGTRVATTNSTTSFSGTNGWTQVVDTFTSSATASYILVQLQNGVAGSGGTVWFDDIVLVPTSSTLRSIA